MRSEEINRSHRHSLYTQSSRSLLESRIRLIAIDPSGCALWRLYKCLWRRRNDVNIYDFRIRNLSFSPFADSSRGPPRSIVSVPLFPASEFRMQMGKTQVRYVTRMRPIRKIMEAKRFFFGFVSSVRVCIIARAQVVVVVVAFAGSSRSRNRGCFAIAIEA